MNSSTKKIKAIPIPIPPLEEQERIVEVLDEAFAAIDKAKANIERNLTNARELFQSRLNDIFSNSSEDWKYVPLENLLTDNTIGLVRNSKEQADHYPIRYIKMNNITPEMTFDESDVTFVRCSDEEFSKFKLEDGDLLFNTRNSFELVGKSCLYSSRVGGPTVFNNNIMRIRFIQEVHAEFVSFFLCSDVAKDQLEAMKSGTTNVIGIYFKSLKNLIVSIPNEEAQMQLVSQLRDMRGMVRSLTHQYTSQINQLEELRQSILEQAFEGKLTEPVAA